MIGRLNATNETVISSQLLFNSRQAGMHLSFKLSQAALSCCKLLEQGGVLLLQQDLLWPFC